MNYTQDNPLLKDLEKVIKVRLELADRLDRIAQTLQEGELEGENTSGKLGLDRESEDISLASKNLRQGVFRLIVLGDLKRGKSTFINALIGEKILPSDVNPCTALLTVLRYGTEKRVTVYFKDAKPAERLDFSSFKQKYTIDPDEAKKLEQEQKLAFPEVDYALVEYPLPLLEKGIEIVDSPGLNDTEARNQLSLGYLNNCHAILFVFRAVQPCTLEERRYLENYLKGRDFTVFFLLNGWDEIRQELIDPDNSEELQQAEEKLRKVFRTNLTEYTQLDGINIYPERVFEISALDALRRRIKNRTDSLEGTGFPEFMKSLNTFLTQDSAVSQMQQARRLARQAYARTHEAVELRIPLLEKDLEELKHKINSVEPEFKQLSEIRDKFQAEIRNQRDRQAKSITNSLREYILNLGDTFETDFVRYQPDLGFLDFLSAGKREQFNAALKQGFERYINEKMVSWELSAEKEMGKAFSQLAKSAAKYGATYNRVLDSISEKLIGQKVNFRTEIGDRDDAPGWSKWAMGFLSLATGNIAGVALAAIGFDWKNILVNWLAVIGISSFVAIFLTPAFLTPLGIAVMSLGVGAVQAEQGRKKFLQAAKKEFTKSLPKIAQEQYEPVYQAVAECFDNYEGEVIKRIDEDIRFRKAELDNLVAQKQSREIDREKELKRLQDLDSKVLSECNKIESAYDYLIFSA